jgi:hypothetical protein
MHWLLFLRVLPAAGQGGRRPWEPGQKQWLPVALRRCCLVFPPGAPMFHTAAVAYCQRLSMVVIFVLYAQCSLPRFTAAALVIMLPGMRGVSRLAMSRRTVRSSERCPAGDCCGPLIL